MTEAEKILPELPVGWTHTSVEAISNLIQYGHTATACVDKVGPKFLRITDIQDSSVKWEDVPYCETEDIDISKYLLYPGDIVFARTGATVGKSYLVQDNVPAEAIFASYLIRIKLAASINPKFVYNFFQSQFYWRQINNSSAGIGQPNVNGKKLGKIVIVLPPLPEQHRIVAKIEEFFSYLDAGVEGLHKVKAQLRLYRQSVLKAAVNGRLTEEWRKANRDVEPAEKLLVRIQEELKSKLGKKYRPSKPDNAALPELPRGWIWASMEQISLKVVDGVHKKPNYVPSGIPFITVRNLTTDDTINFKNTKFVTIEDHRDFCKRTNPEIGDILITKDGTLGVARVIKTENAFSIFVSVALMKPVKSFLNSDYLAIFINSPDGQRQCENIGKGSGLQHLHLEDLRAMTFPIPPLLEQDFIIKEIENRLSGVDEGQRALDQSIKLVDRLRWSILKRAFEGKLVPQDSNDEPASMLLDQIMAERAVQAKRTKGSKNNGTKQMRLIQ
ncbi:MAG: restriction endonuclease subunit S [Methanotrichaceae archaeon]|jgi:type I restriction enzyme S subunit